MKNKADEKYGGSFVLNVFTSRFSSTTSSSVLCARMRYNLTFCFSRTSLEWYCWLGFSQI